MEEFMFDIGQRVIKPVGYPFDGIVVARFLTTAGVDRYVVEKVEPDEDGDPVATGLMHIFAPAQLENDSRFDLDAEPLVAQAAAYRARVAAMSEEDRRKWMEGNFGNPDFPELGTPRPYDLALEHQDSQIPEKPPARVRRMLTGRHGE